MPLSPHSKPHIQQASIEHLRELLASERSGDTLFEDVLQVCGLEDVELVMNILADRPTALHEVSVEKYLMSPKFKRVKIGEYLKQLSGPSTFAQSRCHHSSLVTYSIQQMISLPLLPSPV